MDQVVECCGKLIESNFCPVCGKAAMLDHILAAILAHARQMHLMKKTGASNLRGRIVLAKGESNDNKVAKYVRQLRLAEDAETKWRTWSVILGEVCRNQRGEMKEMQKFYDRGYKLGCLKGDEEGQAAGYKRGYRDALNNAAKGNI